MPGIIYEMLWGNPGASIAVTNGSPFSSLTPSNPCLILDPFPQLASVGGGADGEMDVGKGTLLTYAFPNLF